MRPHAARPVRTLAASHASGQRREHARRAVVRWVFVLYLLLILEGSLRKWLLPQYSQYIFFIRDPVLLWAFLLATRHGLWPRGSPGLAVVLAMAGLGVLLVLVQGASGGSSEHRLVLAAQGFRSYFLYLPLAFLIGSTFGADDLRRLYRLTLWLAVPMAVLVTLQFYAPPGAAINVGIAGDAELQFRGITQTGERTRPMGTFASGAGQQQFVATAWAIALGLLITAAARRGVGWLTLAPGAAAVMVCAGVSGSRGTILQCALAMLFAGAVVLLGRGAAMKGRAAAWTLVLLVAAVLLYPLVLPEGFAAFSERWSAAAQAEQRSFSGGVFGRALYGLIDFVRLVDSVPALGYGLGFGSNASITLRAEVDGVRPGLLAETDFARHMVDLGPVLGFGYIVFRLALLAWLTMLVLRITMQVSDAMPLLLLSYVATTLAQAQITGQGAINAYAWLFAGFLIAACRLAGQAPAGAPPRMAPDRWQR